MSISEKNDWLMAGITAVKAGDRESACGYLTKVLDADENNEKAWLWLSAAVETDADRRLCLENVLALNPDSQIARRELDRLSDSEITPIDRGLEPSTTVSKTPTSVYWPAVPPRDVWDSDEDICAYCATKVEEDIKRCPGCHRSLISMEYRYQVTSVLHFFWVLLFSLGIILIFHAMFKFSIEQDLTSATLHGTAAVVLVLLAVGVYFRQFWVHIFSIIVLIFVLILSIANHFTLFDPAVLGLDNVDPAIRGLTSGLVSRLSILAAVVQTALAALSLFYALFRAGPEFDRVAERLVASTKKGLHTAVDYHMTARRLGQDGRWASATLHWQRAAAIDPTKIVYHRDLAKAYFRLGFVDRGLSVVNAAKKKPMQPAMQAELTRLQDWGQRKLSSRESGG